MGMRRVDGLALHRCLPKEEVLAMRSFARLAGSPHRRFVSSLILAAVLVATTLVASGFTTKKDAGTITIAWVGPQSGPFAPSATSSINTFNEYFNIINKKGGVNGKQLKLVTKDTGGDPTVALQTVRDFAGQGVKVFFLQTYAEESALQPLMDGSIITFTTNPPKQLDDPKLYPYNINWFPPNKYALFKDAQYMKKHGITKVALVTNTTAQFQEYIDAAHDILPKQGIQVVLEQRYDPATTDYSPIITKIKDSGAQATAVFSFGGEATRFYTAAAAANLQQPLLGGYGNAAADLSSVPQDYLKKWAYFVTTATTLLDSNTQKPAFPKYGAIQKQIFYHKYGLKTNIGGGIGWDEVAAIAWSLKKAGGDDPKKMIAAFESTAKASAGIAFTPGGIVYHFSNAQHCGFPPSQIFIAHLYGIPQWPGYYFKAE
jgi:branched-chain amino acid transport system substrate-binding protein